MHNTMSQTFGFSLLLLLPPLLLLVASIIKKRRANPEMNLIRQPPSPPKLPLIGNLHQLGSLPHRTLRSLADKHGPLMHLQLGQVPALIVSSPEMAREVLKTNDLIVASRPTGKGSRHVFQGPDLAFSPYGEYWRQARKLCVTHLLSQKMVQAFERVREEVVETLIAKIARASDSSGSIDMSDVLYSFVSDILSRAVTGKEGRNDVLRELIEENSVVLGVFHVTEFFPVLERLSVFSLDKRAKKNGERWNGVLDEVLREYEKQSTLTSDDDDRRDSARKYTNFVDVLLSLEKQSGMDFSFTRQNFKAILIDMFGAGTDTTYMVLEWTVTELVRNPQVMKKLKDELRGVANSNRAIRDEDVNKLTYLKAVIKEALRLHPPIPLYPRVLSEDCELAGYRVAKGTKIVTNVWAIGRDPKVWDEPDEFRPERFVGSGIDFRGSDFQLVPFGSGRRICPGINFAAAAMELAVANLVHRFDWEIPGNDMDMAEAPGQLGARKKERLRVKAKLVSFAQN